MSRAAERSRAGFLRRITPVMDGALSPGESVVAWGYAMQRPSRGTTFVLGGLSGLAIKHYCVALTDRRVIVLRMVNVGTAAEVERTASLDAVGVSDVRKTLLDVRLEIDVAGRHYSLRFPGAYRAAGADLAARLTHAAG